MRGLPTVSVSLVLVVASQAFAACAGPSGNGAGTPLVSAGKPVAITRANARQRCASASASGTPLRVEHLVVTRLSNVRTWVTQGGYIDWQTFSQDLANQPASEQLAVCVVSHADGTLLSFPGDSRKARSAVVIVSPTGSTMYEEGRTYEMIDSLVDLQPHQRPHLPH